MKELSFGDLLTPHARGSGIKKAHYQYFDYKRTTCLIIVIY